MKPLPDRLCTAFADDQRIATGPVIEVALKVKAHAQKTPGARVLIFDDQTSQPVELDLRGSVENVRKRLETQLVDPATAPTPAAGPGRPKLGVVAREVTLMPQHWEWLASQPGGASVTLRKLVEAAKHQNRPRDELRRAQDAVYKFMTVMAGDRAGYEEALRAFYAKKFDVFEALIAPWPKDVRAHLRKLCRDLPDYPSSK